MERQKNCIVVLWGIQTLAKMVVTTNYIRHGQQAIHITNAYLTKYPICIHEVTL